MHNYWQLLNMFFYSEGLFWLLYTLCVNKEKWFWYFMAILIFHAQKGHEISELFWNFIWKIGIIPIFHDSGFFHTTPGFKIIALGVFNAWHKTPLSPLIWSCELVLSWSVSTPLQWVTKLGRWQLFSGIGLFVGEKVEWQCWFDCSLSMGTNNNKGGKHWPSNPFSPQHLGQPRNPQCLIFCWSLVGCMNVWICCSPSKNLGDCM